MVDGWTSEEVVATVEDYFDMLALELVLVHRRLRHRAISGRQDPDLADPDLDLLALGDLFDFFGQQGQPFLDLQRRPTSLVTRASRRSTVPFETA